MTGTEAELHSGQAGDLLFDDELVWVFFISWRPERRFFDDLLPWFKSLFLADW